jgi:prepilin-type N-terminal cleavage/methylation domain-containing protein/prepilin-type processing-associated H-X9-DG protein
MSMPESNNHKAFTLVELLVVIAIIALLMSILMPALGRARKQAQAVICQSQLNSWGMALQLFAHDNDGSFLKSYTYYTGDPEDWWMVGLLPYIGGKVDQQSESRDLFLCPSAARSKNPPECNRCPGSTFSTWGPFNPGNAGGGDWWDWRAEGSYGINDWVANPPAELDTYWGFPTKYCWRNTAINGAANVPVFLDCMYVSAYVLHFDDPPPFYDQYDTWASNGIQMFAMDRHSGGVNAVFADWSVRKVGIKELWTLKWHNQFDISGPWTAIGGAVASDWPEWMRAYTEY